MHWPHVPKWLAFALCAAATLRAIPALASPGVPDTLVTGSVAAGSGRSVGVSVGGVACPVIAGGSIDGAGSFQVVVGGCGPGTGTLTVDGVPTRFTFTVRPGVVVNVTGTGGIGGVSPGPSPVAGQPTHVATGSAATPPARTPVVAPPPVPAAPGSSAASSSAGSGMPLPDGLVVGRVAARDGQVVTVSAGGRRCATVGGGVVAAGGSFALVVANCGPGIGTLFVDGVATNVTFVTRPGGVVTVGGPAGP